MKKLLLALVLLGALPASAVGRWNTGLAAGSCTTFTFGASDAGDAQMALQVPPGELSFSVAIGSGAAVSVSFYEITLAAGPPPETLPNGSAAPAASVGTRLLFTASGNSSSPSYESTNGGVLDVDIDTDGDGGSVKVCSAAYASANRNRALTGGEFTDWHNAVYLRSIDFTVGIDDDLENATGVWEIIDVGAPVAPTTQLVDVGSGHASGVIQLDPGTLANTGRGWHMPRATALPAQEGRPGSEWYLAGRFTVSTSAAGATWLGINLVAAGGGNCVTSAGILNTATSCFGCVLLAPTPATLTCGVMASGSAFDVSQAFPTTFATGRMVEVVIEVEEANGVSGTDFDAGTLVHFEADGARFFSVTLNPSFGFFSYYGSPEIGVVNTSGTTFVSQFDHVTWTFDRYFQ